MMEISDVEIRRTERGGFEAEKRGDFLNSGDDGYFVSVVGWGPTEDAARANLKAALDEIQRMS
jgi:hypothetical protein